jgi:formylglycine-generating enzyme required for sulfatase activity
MKRAGLIFLSMMFLNSALPAFAQKKVPEAVTVPAGTLQPFWLKPEKNGSKQVFQTARLKVQTHQVTNSDFLVFLKSHPEWNQSQVSPLFAEQGYLNQFESDLTLKKGVNPEAPVTSVSWFAARAYCESIGYRLPTMVEWEYFAAASETQKDANKDPAFLERILTWYGQPKTENLPKVKSIYRNLYGLHDPHGLVWEWVEDFNSNFVNGESREDSSFNRDLFCGAGSMNSGDKENYAAFMRFAFRASLKGTSAIWNLGFRCVKEEKK